MFFCLSFSLQLFACCVALLGGSPVACPFSLKKKKLFDVTSIYCMHLDCPIPTRTFFSTGPSCDSMATRALQRVPELFSYLAACLWGKGWLMWRRVWLKEIQRSADCHLNREDLRHLLR